MYPINVQTTTEWITQGSGRFMDTKKSINVYRKIRKIVRVKINGRLKTLELCC